MDRIKALAKKVGTKVPGKGKRPDNRDNKPNSSDGSKKSTPTNSSRNSKQSTPARKPVTQGKANDEVAEWRRKLIYRALMKHKRDKRLKRENAKSMGERVNQKSKEANFRGKGMKLDDCNSTEDSSSSLDDLDAIKYLKVPIDKKKDEVSQLQTHEFDDKDKADDIGDFFYSLNRKIKFDYCSHLNSKMKPDIMTARGFMKGTDYTYDFLKSGSKSTQVLEVRAFYDSDEDKYYEHINDYVHDQLSKNMPNRIYRYYNDDIFTGTLLCDLCHKLGHTVNNCKLKSDTCVLWGSTEHQAQYCYLKSWFFCKEQNHVYSRCPDIQSRRFAITPMDKWDKCQIFGHTTDRCFIKVLRSKIKEKYKEKIFCLIWEEQWGGTWGKTPNPQFADYDDDFYHHRFSLGTELQWVSAETDIRSTTQRKEFDCAKDDEKKMKEERKQWFDNYAARLKELEDQKLHNHLMDHMAKTDIDYKRALVERHWDEQADFIQIDGKLINNKRKGKAKVDEKYEHALNLEFSYDHIHGGSKVEDEKEEQDKKEEEPINTQDEDKRLEAIKSKCEQDYKNELLGIQSRINDQKQIDIKTMLRNSKRAENRKVLKSGPFSRDGKQKNDMERFAEDREYHDNHPDDDIGFIGYAEKSFETKIKTDFMRKLSKELIDLIKDEVNKDIGEYNFINKEKDDVNPFEAFFKKRDKPGLFDSQPSAMEETSSQEGSVWSNDYGKRSVFTITSKSPSSKIDTTPSDLFMKSDHSKNSDKSSSKKNKMKFFDLEDSECSQI
jgi:hypothetical protein